MVKKVFIIGVIALLTFSMCAYGFAAIDERPATGMGGTKASTNSSDGNAPFYGSKVAYAAEDGLYCTNVDDGKANLLVKGTGISTPVFSSDGKSVAFMQDNALHAYVFATSKARMLLERVESYCPSQNGEFYASAQENGIVAVNSQTADSSTIVPAQGGTSYIHLELSPDLKYLAYDSIVSGVDNQDKGGTWLYDTASKKTHMVVKATKMDDTSMGTRPSVGKWSPDSGKILIWLMSQSASLSADGVGAAVYDVAGGKLKELDTGALAYDENVSFANPTTFAMVSGGSRMMFEGKRISLFNLKKGLSSAETLEIPDKVPTTPCYSIDGKRLAFAASPAAKDGDDFKNQMVTILKRQIYTCIDGKLSVLTNDNTYRSEAPIFLKNNDIVFARINTDGEKSVWMMDSEGNNQKLLARWKYSDPNDNRFTDFYGRIDWSIMFDVFDNTGIER